MSVDILGIESKFPNKNINDGLDSVFGIIISHNKHNLNIS